MLNFIKKHSVIPIANSIKIRNKPLTLFSSKYAENTKSQSINYQSFILELDRLCFKMIVKEILEQQWLMPILKQNKHTERSESMRHFDV